jgi:phosphoserine phosphatase
MRWPPYTHVIFDCDSTLTAIEGIDVLAAAVGKQWRVEVLTRAAMDGQLDLEAVFSRRLAAVKPTRGQVQAIRRAYKRHVVEDAVELIAALKMLGHQVYIISGGLDEAVAEFGLFLGVEREHIHAVALEFDQLSGEWWAADEAQARYLTFDPGPLTITSGKADIIRELLTGQVGRTLLIGDGSSDLEAAVAVDLFVGYGGVTARPRVMQTAPACLHSRSLSPLLALAAGPALMVQLRATPQAALVDKAINLIQQGAVTFNDERLNQKFYEAYQAVYSRPG